MENIIKKKILILEDDKHILNNLCELLESEDYYVKTASNGKEGIDILKAYKPDLILCDIMMPHINGYEFYEIVKKNFDTKFIPFIFLTAKTDLTSIRAGMNLGADDYITKPFSASDLLKTINLRLSKQNEFNQQFESLVRNINMYIPHELRTPLVAIIGYAQLMLSEIDGMDKKELREMIERILWAANRLHGRIEKFISYSELNLSYNSEGGAEENQFTDIDYFFVNRIVGSHYLLSDRDASIDINIEPACIAIPERYLERLLKEIIENAVKYSTFNSQIIIRGIPDGEFFKITVKDSGIGMTKEEIENIGVFRQFSREAHSQDGNGLGLSMAQRILKNYNGSFSIESEKNNFTEVTIKLPIISP